LEEFFAYVAELLKTNPPKPEDTEIVAQMTEIGIVPGEDFDASKLQSSATGSTRSSPSSNWSAR
jgi:hypothetical protein